LVVIVPVTILSLVTNAQTGELHIGTARTDITPSLPAAIKGQFYLRIADSVESPLTANVIALESQSDNNKADLAIMVSCDLTSIPLSYIRMVRSKVKSQLPGLEVNKIFIGATHTHTAPVLETGGVMQYAISDKDILHPEEYQEFFTQQVSDAIVKAWKNRAPGSVTWGLGHASVANNRRLVFAARATDPGPFLNGTAQMYGDPDSPDFRHFEGMAEDDVNSLFFWNKDGRLIAMTIEVPCTAQEVEQRRAINADYWHPVRQKLHQKYGEQLCIVGWAGVSGDQSPHLMYRKSAEERMRNLRGLTRLEEIARRIVLAVEETYETVKDERQSSVHLIHKVEIIDLPELKISEREYQFAKAEQEKYAAMIEADPATAEKVKGRETWNGNIVRRYESQQEDPFPVLETEIHVLRIGDVALCTNQFELYTDYGIRIQARSKAVQTFTLQLVGPGSYIPTAEAIHGGGYSAIPQSCPIGPEGGQILVDRTVELIDELFWETTTQ